MTNLTLQIGSTYTTSLHVSQKKLHKNYNTTGYNKHTNKGKKGTTFQYNEDITIQHYIQRMYYDKTLQYNKYN